MVGKDGYVFLLLVDWLNGRWVQWKVEWKDGWMDAWMLGWMQIVFIFWMDGWNGWISDFTWSARVPA